ncbi:Malonyl-CoA decarboxylase [Phytophthora nicotianae]|uniref:Malonyl-CoA decarboxylase n=1 Tax=Phytophthora nicotianae TaxID=4792 RepID=A0A0W8BZB9_PHYNI|nr:Malonyl-CoA decarboxylase [Phytophthora nicotianae]
MSSAPIRGLWAARVLRSAGATQRELSITKGDISSKSKRGGDAAEDSTHQRQRSSFLRSIDLSNPAAQRKLSKLIQEVVKTKANTGDFVPQVVIQSLCTTYRGMDIDEKKQFLLILAQDLHIDTAMALQSAAQFEQNMNNIKDARSGDVNWEHENVERYLRTFRNLRNALAPLYEVLTCATFFQQILSQRENGMLFLVHMRADLLQVLRKSATHSELPALRSLDASLKHFLASWFSVGFLKLQRVTYEHSPGQLLEKIIRYEAVHPVGTIAELKRRLGNGRRCFAFFHPSIPDEPLVFVHVALMHEIASSMQSIRDETEQLSEDSQAYAAIFYSISSTQKGLAGVDLGNFLIKEVAKALKTEHPHLKTFATLSPLPQFMLWLETQRYKTDESLVSPLELDALIDVLEERGNAIQSDATPVSIVLDTLSIDKWIKDPELVTSLKPIMLKLGARYIYHEKKRGKALDPVANFHVRNGAIFERINWQADLSKKGLAQSAGMMINYKYDLAHVEANNENYLLHNIIPIGLQPQQIGNVKSRWSWRKTRSMLAEKHSWHSTRTAMGQQPTEEELFQMISEVDEDMSGAIDFAEFLQVIDNQKDRAAMFEDDSDMIDAFVACGGKPDKSGFVRKETLVKIIKGDFGLTINIEEMINKLDVDGSGEIEFDEFKAILT